jgi:hypothetical protein
MEEANTQMRLLEALKKEFRLTRILWRQIFDQVKGFPLGEILKDQQKRYYCSC